MLLASGQCEAREGIAAVGGYAIVVVSFLPREHRR